MSAAEKRAPVPATGLSGSRTDSRTPASETNGSGDLRASLARGMAASRRRAERVLSAAAPLVLAANQPAEVPDEVAFRAWEEFIYPRNGAEHPPSPGWERALAVINEWLSGRAVVLRGEQT